jgi:hypothetical protein
VISLSTADRRLGLAALAALSAAARTSPVYLSGLDVDHLRELARWLDAVRPDRISAWDARALGEAMRTAAIAPGVIPTRVQKADLVAAGQWLIDSARRVRATAQTATTGRSAR